MRLEFLENENHLWVTRLRINFHGISYDLYTLQVETIRTKSAWWTWRGSYQCSGSGKWIVDWNTVLAVKSTKSVRRSKSSSNVTYIPWSLISLGEWLQSFGTRQWRDVHGTRHSVTTDKDNAWHKHSYQLICSLFRLVIHPTPSIAR